MPDNRGHLLPVYVLADESYSMAPYAEELNAGMVSLHEALRSEPMVAAKVRLSVLGFSDNVTVRMSLADLRARSGTARPADGRRDQLPRRLLRPAPAHPAGHQ